MRNVGIRDFCAHRDFGGSLEDYAREPWLDEGELAWRDPGASGDETILRGAADPFQPEGGMRLMEGNLGRACFKTSAVEPSRWTIEAPCRVFDNQPAVAEAFAAGAAVSTATCQIAGAGGITNRHGARAALKRRHSAPLPFSRTMQPTWLSGPSQFTGPSLGPSHAISPGV